MSAEDAKNYAKSRLSAWNWNENQFDSLNKLWNAESNWNYKAKNPKSGAAGIPQLIGGSNVENFDNDYKVQIEHGFFHIKKNIKHQMMLGNFFKRSIGIKPI